MTLISFHSQAPVAGALSVPMAGPGAAMPAEAALFASFLQMVPMIELGSGSTRQADAAGGKTLPASPGSEELPHGELLAPWLAMPMCDVVPPSFDAAGVEPPEIHDTAAPAAIAAPPPSLMLEPVGVDPIELPSPIPGAGDVDTAAATAARVAALSRRGASVASEAAPTPDLAVIAGDGGQMAAPTLTSGRASLMASVALPAVELPPLVAHAAASVLQDAGSHEMGRDDPLKSTGHMVAAPQVSEGHAASDADPVMAPLLADRTVIAANATPAVGGTLVVGAAATENVEPLVGRPAIVDAVVTPRLAAVEASPASGDASITRSPAPIAAAAVPRASLGETGEPPVTLGVQSPEKVARESDAPFLSPVTIMADRAGQAGRGSAVTPTVQVPSLAPQAVPQPAAVPAIAPAAQVFAAAIHQAVRDERRLDPAEGLIASAGIASSAAVGSDLMAAAPIVMTSNDWPIKMIGRIEMIRDALDAVDTSIRLVPDKLGAIDVSLHREGDAVAVQMIAQSPETRQILAEAQPRLVELAEARGLKLSAHLGDGSSTGQQHQQQPQAQRTPTGAPATSNRSTHLADSDAGGGNDDRIA
ncbi:flagellar hook-length control protein FliK [Sphingomonas olei]